MPKVKCHDTEREREREREREGEGERGEAAAEREPMSCREPSEKAD